MTRAYALPEAPLHLFPGSDAVAMAETKHEQVWHPSRPSRPSRRRRRQPSDARRRR